MDGIVILAMAVPLAALTLYYLFPRKSVLMFLSGCPIVCFLVFQALFWGGMMFHDRPKPTASEYAYEVFKTLLWISGQLLSKLWFAALFALLLTAGATLIFRRYPALPACGVAFVVAAVFSNTIFHFLTHESAMVMILLWTLPFMVLGKFTADAIKGRKSA